MGTPDEIVKYLSEYTADHTDISCNECISSNRGYCRFKQILSNFDAHDNAITIDRSKFYTGLYELCTPAINCSADCGTCKLYTRSLNITDCIALSIIYMMRHDSTYKPIVKFNDLINGE